MSDLQWSIDTCGLAMQATVPPTSYSPSSGRVERSEERATEASEKVERVRRFESAHTDRLNEAHWETANTQHINIDLTADLPTLWSRCVYEASNNPLIEGVIETHITDTIGENGPTCQITATDPNADLQTGVWKQYTDEAEQMIRELNDTGWDLHDELPLSELLALWIWGEWTFGDKLAQEVSRPRRPYDVAVRLNPIDPRRLMSPWGEFNARMCLGVERDPDGRRVNYWFTEPQDTLRYGILQPRPIPAQYIYHEFRRREVGQVRGVPLLAGCLSVLADLRDFDAETLDAARSAAHAANVAYTDSPEGGFIEQKAGDSIALKRRQLTYMPPGWKPMSLPPVHPSTQYVQFRRERLRELGRSVAMPLMTILLDASEHNYSSARMDGQNYQRVLRRWQNRVERKLLNRYVQAVLLEAESLGIIRRRPGRIALEWMWDPIPHVDPSKEAEADDLQLANYQLDPYTASRKANRDFSQIARRWARANAELASLNLPPVGAALASPPSSRSSGSGRGNESQPNQPT